MLHYIFWAVPSGQKKKGGACKGVAGSQLTCCGLQVLIAVSCENYVPQLKRPQGLVASTIPVFSIGDSVGDLSWLINPHGRLREA